MIVVKNVIKNEADTLQVTFLRSNSKRNCISYQLSFTFQCDVIYQVQFISHNKLTWKNGNGFHRASFLYIQASLDFTKLQWKKNVENLIHSFALRF